MALQDDLDWFESNRAFIAKNYGGQWVLIKDKAIKGAYPTQEAALTAGFSMFKTQPFVVKQALAEEPVHRVLR
jgi:hypothetical protein